ncbi:MAG: protein kinase domain-containing protein [Flammeovirgaceae bacterium]
MFKAAQNILIALNHLHSIGIVHRDIKSANILRTNNTYKVGDLNVSKIMRNNHLAYTQTGTPYYASPEVWRD